MKSKLESPFIKATLLVLEEGEYGHKLTHTKFEELKNTIATCVKAFYLMGKKGFEIDDCKKFMLEFDGDGTIEDLLEKVENGAGEEK